MNDLTDVITPIDGLELLAAAYGVLSGLEEAKKAFEASGAASTAVLPEASARSLDSQGGGSASTGTVDVHRIL